LTRHEALKEWKDNTKSPTYDRLLRICIAGKWKDAANTIVKLLSSESPEKAHRGHYYYSGSKPLGLL